MSLPGGYVSLLDEAEQKRLLLAFARNYERLLALKRPMTLMTSSIRRLATSRQQKKIPFPFSSRQGRWGKSLNNTQDDKRDVISLRSSGSKRAHSFQQSIHGVSGA